MDQNTNEPKFQKIAEAANGLSLGISMVVAIVLGVGIGIVLKNLFGYGWLLWVGVFWGVVAAIMNVVLAYKKQKASLDELALDPKYRHIQNKKNDSYDDEEDDL